MTTFTVVFCPPSFVVVVVVVVWCSSRCAQAATAPGSIDPLCVFVWVWWLSCFELCLHSVWLGSIAMLVLCPSFPLSLSLPISLFAAAEKDGNVGPLGTGLVSFVCFVCILHLLCVPFSCCWTQSLAASTNYRPLFRFFSLFLPRTANSVWLVSAACFHAPHFTLLPFTLSSFSPSYFYF